MALNSPCWNSPPSIAFWPAERALNGPPSCTGGGLPNEVPACRTWVAGTEVPTDGCWIGIPLASDDVGPTAKVGGEPPGRVWGSGVPLGTLRMVLRGWSKKKVACAVPPVRGVRRPTTPGPVFGHVCGMGEVGRQKNASSNS